MGAQGAPNQRLEAWVLLLLCLCEARPAASNSDPDYYHTLGVEPTATDRQIKRAFRQLAVKYHPDKSKSAGAEKTFREIAEAYKVLSNNEKRRLYDTVGHEAFLNNEASLDPEDEHESNFYFSFSDFYQEFDEGPFVEESHFHWSFYEEVKDQYEQYSFEGPDSFYFEDIDDNEEEQYF